MARSRVPASYVLGTACSKRNGQRVRLAMKVKTPAGLQHSLADPNAALHGALAVMASLLCRDRRGAGQYLDLSQLEAVIDPIVPYLLASQSDPTLLRPLGNRDPLGGFSGVYQCLAIEMTSGSRYLAPFWDKFGLSLEIIAYPLANGDVGDGQMEGLDRCLNN